MSSRSNFIFGPFADSAWKQPKITSHADPAVARHLFAKTPQRTTRAHYVEHAAGDKRGMAGGALGWIGAESGHGPNTKIEARTKLYIFH